MNVKDTSKPVILAVETSGRKGSVALACGSETLAHRFFQVPMRHSSELFPAICDLVKEAKLAPVDIDQCFFSVGPGSFTGIRIAVATAKMFAFSADVKLLPVNTLDVIAENASASETAKEGSRIAVVLDAKRSSFFSAFYEMQNSTWVKTVQASLLSAEELKTVAGEQSEPLWLLGEGLVYYRKKFECENVRFLGEQFWYPDARKLVSLGRRFAEKNHFADPLSLSPLYLRRPEAKVKGA